MATPHKLPSTPHSEAGSATLRRYSRRTAHMDPDIKSSDVQVVLESSEVLVVHVLTAGNSQHRWLLLVHGFPELAFSWRKVMPLLAQAGYFVIAADMLGYGGTRVRYDENGKEPNRHDEEMNHRVEFHAGLERYNMLYNVGQLTGLLKTMRKIYPSENNKLASVIGHDMGSSIAANLALLHPELVDSLIMMSAPYTGPPSPESVTLPTSLRDLQTAKSEMLNRLSSIHRKHYQLYFTTEAASQDFNSSTLEDLRRIYCGYYYYKSAHHSSNTGASAPQSLGEKWTLAGIQKLPYYYLMEDTKSMRQTVLDNTPPLEEMLEAMSGWMTLEELQYYVRSFYRTGFQGGLNHYRARLAQDSSGDTAKLRSHLYFSPDTSLANAQKSEDAARIKVPGIFISGRHDWGTYQDPGSLSVMSSDRVFDPPALFKGVKLVDGAGHWVQQEQPELLVEIILRFMQDLSP